MQDRVCQNRNFLSVAIRVLQSVACGSPLIQDCILLNKQSHWSLCSYELICRRGSSPIRAGALPENLRKISEEIFVG